MHFCYIDEAGSTGEDLQNTQQPVFIMAGLLVSDEKWRKTAEAVENLTKRYLGVTEIPAGFEIHTHQLLSPNGEGPFSGHERDRRSAFALALLQIIVDRSHSVIYTPLVKSSLSALEVPTRTFGVDHKNPWDLAFDTHLTMFEDFLRGPSTGRTSTGLVIIDHHDVGLETVRSRSDERQRAGGWRHLKKIVEIGYSVSSHANPMIQLADVVAFTLKKFHELSLPISDAWPEAARDFYSQCKATIWPKMKFKTLTVTKLNYPATTRDYVRASARTPD